MVVTSKPKSVTLAFVAPLVPLREDPVRVIIVHLVVVLELNGVMQMVKKQSVIVPFIAPPRVVKNSHNNIITDK